MRVRRRRAGVVVGHRPIEVQVSVDVAVDALDSRERRIEVAEERPRDAAGAGVDAVVRAVLSVVAVYSGIRPVTDRDPAFDALLDRRREGRAS